MGKSLQHSGNWKELLDYLREKDCSGLTTGRGRQNKLQTDRGVGSPEHPRCSFEGIVETSEHEPWLNWLS